VEPVSAEKLERVSARTFRIRKSDDKGPQTASRFVSRFELPGAAQASIPSRFAGRAAQRSEGREASERPIRDIQ
jgi:hypothetical protein